MFRPWSQHLVIMVKANMYEDLVEDLRAADDDDSRPARSVMSECLGQEPAAMTARRVVIWALHMMELEVPRLLLVSGRVLSSLGSRALV